MAPDERNIGGIVRKAIKTPVSLEWKESNPGVYVSQKGLSELVAESCYGLVYLHEDGEDVRSVASELDDCLFVLGDHLGVDKDQERFILEKAWKVVCVSPLSLQADQCILILHNELDRTLIG
jgi:tRNA (pseudouridine54-N1)-methyltransferase